MSGSASVPFGQLSCCQDIINDVAQIGTFVYHGDFWFAAFMVVFIGLSLLRTFTSMSSASQLRGFDPLGEAKLCLARQVPTLAWQEMLMCDLVG